MTATTNSVSNRSVPAPSAIQARANSQSAVISLLGAGTASPNTGEKSFADSLQSESQRQNTAQGLFSDAADSARPDRRSDRSIADSPRPNDARTPKAPRPEDEETGPLVKSSSPRRSDGTSTDDPSPEVPLTLDELPTARPPNAALNPPAHLASQPPTGTQSDPASQNPEAAAEQAGANAAGQKTRQPSDPLRLIVPQQQSQEDAAIPTNGTTTQSGPNVTPPIGNSTQPASKQATMRVGEGVPVTRSIGPATTNQAAGAAVAAAHNAATAASASTGTGAAVGGLSAAAGSASTGGTPIDQVAPPRVPGGRPIEQPVTLKLKAPAQPTNETPRLSETEITAAETMISRGLTTAFRQNTPQVTLWMSPETLGKVRIQLTFDQGTISARFEATSDATKDLLASNMNALRDALQSRGLTANQIEVVSIPDWSHQQNSQTGNGEGRSANEQSSNQPGNGSNNPFGSGEQPKQGTPEHSKGWTALPQGDAPTAHASASDAQISLAVDGRMMTLQAHLELDAVA
ncbi:MAG: flagellar hook-length control protein FliK [Phycisphaerae bacterium]|nr:flagellar hook-length control protein FliK [Phycisphaerae bacterium]